MKWPQIGQKGEKTMTFREKLMEEHPEMLEKTLKKYCSVCPEEYGYENYFDCPDNLDCRDCWGREMKEDKS